MSEALASLRALLELGFPAIVLLQLWLVWRSYVAASQAHINDLRLLIKALTEEHKDTPTRACSD